jgi:hypothetical protein
MHMPASTANRTAPPSRLRPWLLRCLAAVALALVFSWYLSPHFVVDMAARIWSCI